MIEIDPKLFPSPSEFPVSDIEVDAALDWLRGEVKQLVPAGDPAGRVASLIERLVRDRDRSNQQAQENAQRLGEVLFGSPDPETGVDRIVGLAKSYLPRELADQLGEFAVEYRRAERRLEQSRTRWKRLVDDANFAREKAEEFARHGERCVSTK